jgi:hypothetical protein
LTVRLNSQPETAAGLNPDQETHMFAPRHIHRAAIGCGLVCTLLLAAVMSPAAAAYPGPQDDRSAAARGGARTSRLDRTPSTPRQDLRSPDRRDAARAEDIALAQQPHPSSPLLRHPTHEELP